jgi:hypothetical protein
MSTLPDAFISECDVCGKFTNHYRPPNWEWMVAAGGRAFQCIPCEDQQDGANA